MIEEYAEVDLVPLSGRTNRSLWLAIMVGIALVAFGFAGHVFWTPPSVAVESVDPSDPATPPRIGPVPRPNAAPAVRFAVLDKAAAKLFEGEVVSILEVTNTTEAGATTVRLRRSAESARSEGGLRLLVDGDVPSNVDAVTIDIRAASGTLLASTVVPSVGDERPGSDGRPRHGNRSLRWQLVVPGLIPPDGWQLTITWQDGSNASLGSVVQWIPAVSLGREQITFEESGSEADQVGLPRRPVPSDRHGR